VREATRFRCAAVVTDIEGTTGSIAFVKDVLFPYARDHLAAYVAAHRDDAQVTAVLAATRAEANEPNADEARTLEILRAWMRDDRKATPLKTLQGWIWRDGYARVELRGHVYPDAVEALRRWHAAGVALYVYSSGSIAAQQLLFGQSTAGDLRFLFSDYFDTTTGAKSEPSSYAAIVARIGCVARDVLFLSDRDVELDAAHAAGLQVARLMRPEDTLPNETVSAYPAFTSFASIDLTRSSDP
jgi:enolase-phosphatase E1